MEAVTSIPQSPNWFTSGVLDASPHDPPLFAFAARSRIVVMRTACPGSLSILAGHRSLSIVSSVCFIGEDSAPPLCVSAGSDKQVILWDVEAGKVLRSHREHQTRVVAIASPGPGPDSHVAITVDEASVVAVWDTQSNQRASWQIGTGEAERPTVAAVLEGAFGSHLAVGTTGGRVHTFAWRRGEPVGVWQAHAEFVQAIAPLPGPWAPSGGAAWFATSGRDAMVHVWRAGEEWGAEAWSPPARSASAALPRPGGGKGGDSAAFAGGRSVTAHQRTRLWLTVEWTLAPGGAGEPALLSSAFLGDLLLWRLPPSLLAGGARPGALALGEPETLPEAHSRSVFRIVCPRAWRARRGAPPGGLWGAAPGSLVPECITASMDRSVSLLAREAGGAGRFKVAWNLPCLGGFAYGVAVSPVSPLRVAVACGDCTLRLWQRANALAPPAGTTMLWKGLTASRITCVRWHPWHEEVLVYATEAGGVGALHTQGEPHKSRRSVSPEPVAALECIEGEGGLCRAITLGSGGSLLSTSIRVERRAQGAQDERTGASIVVGASHDLTADALALVRTDDGGVRTKVTALALCRGGADRSLLVLGFSSGEFACAAVVADGPALVAVGAASAVELVDATPGGSGTSRVRVRGAWCQGDTAVAGGTAEAEAKGVALTAADAVVVGSEAFLALGTASGHLLCLRAPLEGGESWSELLSGSPHGKQAVAAVAWRDVPAADTDGGEDGEEGGALEAEEDGDGGGDRAMGDFDAGAGGGERGESWAAARRLLERPAHVVSGGADGKCFVHALVPGNARGRECAQGTCHPTRILCLAWDPSRADALQFFTGSDDQSLRVWAVREE